VRSGMCLWLVIDCALSSYLSLFPLWLCTGMHIIAYISERAASLLLPPVPKRLMTYVCHVHMVKHAAIGRFDVIPCFLSRSQGLFVLFFLMQARAF
jgi:hypothetical protein